MHISPIENVNNKNIKYIQKQSVQNPTAHYSQSSDVQKATTEAIKAKFCPSFGKYRKVASVPLVDRLTGKNVIADLKCDKFGKDLISYKLYVGREEAGFMDMDCAAKFPDSNDFVLPATTDEIPEIQHIRSILGHRYAGIGTALMNAAVQESEKHGKNGYLWLKTESGYAWSFSPYRAKENPVPFYYKLGFEAVDKRTNDLIKHCVKNSNYRALPDSVLMLLTPDAIDQKNKYFAAHYNVS